MFRRRQPLPFFRWLRGLLWPRTGWRRFGVYYLKRLIRLSGTPHNIAAGVACGAAISFTPLVGLHIVLGAALALVVRGNFLAVVAGTLVGNPWTFPFIWVASYQVGQFLLGGHAVAAQSVTFGELAGYFADAGRQLTAIGPFAAMQHLASDLSVVVWPTLVGSVLLGIVAGLLIYIPLVRIIAAYQEARRRRREHRGRDGAETSLKAAGAPTDAGVG